ncbi:MAG: hypothetical protein ACRC0V_00160 [Fusobacteriaceae bacterium]
MKKIKLTRLERKGVKWLIKRELKRRYNYDIQDDFDFTIVDNKIFLDFCGAGYLFLKEEKAVFTKIFFKDHKKEFLYIYLTFWNSEEINTGNIIR